MFSLKDRLLSAEDECLGALVEGGEVLSNFLAQWEILAQDLDVAHDTAILDADTSALAHAVALRIAELADISADLFTSYDDITTDLIAELDGLMLELSLTRSSARALQSPSPPPDRHRARVSSSSPKSLKRARSSSDTTPTQPRCDRKRRRYVAYKLRCPGHMLTLSQHLLQPPRLVIYIPRSTYSIISPPREGIR